jgi:predicted acyl esterase
VLDPSVIDRVESEWPPARAVAKKLYLKDSTQLAERPPEAIAQLSYDTASKEKLSLSYAFAEDTEITGYMSLRLWVEAKGSNDMELAITVEKRDAKGNPYNRELGEGMVGPVAATGLLRVSHRELDPKLSTPSEPYLTHRSEQFLSPGEIVPVDISIWPMAMRYKAGEELYLTISAHHPMSTDFDMGFGAAPIELAESEITYMPGKAVALKKFGGTAATSPSYIHDLRVPTPVSRNHGTHVIHVGGRHDSHLLIPLIPA